MRVPLSEAGAANATNHSANGVDLETGGNSVATPALLAESPRLQFLAWQNEWATNHTRPGTACHLDGSPVTNATELDCLHYRFPPDIYSLDGTKPDLPVLLLWFSHPLFDKSSAVEVTLLDPKGRQVSLRAYGSMGTSYQTHDSQNGVLGWIEDALCPGERRTNVSARLTVRLRYTIGPLEDTRETSPDYNGQLALLGKTYLNGIGQDINGRTFIAIASNPVTLTSCRYIVMAVTRDGRELSSVGGGGGDADVDVLRFYFDTPLTNVTKFIIGSRPIRTMEWKDVVLPEN